MPDATAKIWTQLGLGDIKRFDLSTLQWGQLHLGTKLGEIQAVFPRADKSAVERMHKMEEQKDGSAPEAAAAVVAPTIASPAKTESPTEPKPPVPIAVGNFSIADFPN